MDAEYNNLDWPAAWKKIERLEDEREASAEERALLEERCKRLTSVLMDLVVAVSQAGYDEGGRLAEVLDEADSLIRELDAEPDDG